MAFARCRRHLAPLLTAVLFGSAPVWAQGDPPLSSPAPPARSLPANVSGSASPTLSEAEERPTASGNTAAGNVCRADLDRMGAVYENPDAIKSTEDPGCGIPAPVRLLSPVQGITLPGEPTLDCEAALGFTLWVRRHLVPVADALGRGALTRIDTGPGYACRRRNNAATGKLSEHATGNAIDVTGFGFADGSTLSVAPREDDHTKAHAFQRTARASACLHFTTVLGPGTNAAHADHLHLDTAKRRGGYRICQ